MSDLTTIVDTYLSAYGEQDAARRAELISQVWAADGRLVDPPLAAEGRDGISDIDEHHDQFRFAWELVGPDGTVAVSGIDVGELAEDGRLRRITGFFGELPARDDA